MIVCLGWGSLIWNPDCLAIIGKWKMNGPEVPVEYLRQSNNGRLTLVIDPQVPKSTVLWAKMKTNNLAEAKENLRVREGKAKPEYIGSWRQGDPGPEEIPTLALWAEQVQASAVIWTALPAKFDNMNFRKPSYPEAVKYLKGLPRDKRILAEEYVRRTPLQVRTPYREHLEDEFGWTPESPIN